MKKSEEIYEGFGKSFSLKEFIREHKVGILGTVAFHLILLITFLLTEIKSLRDEVSELSIVMEFADEQDEAEEAEETHEEMISRLLDQQLNQSNQAVNIQKLEEELSTEKYVDQVMNELKEERSEEWLEQQEELQNILNQEDIVPVETVPEIEEEEKEFTGPTNINYEFLSSPYDRKSLDLPVPVYKCRGYGVVEVSIEVNRSGDVTSARAHVLEATEDPDCLADVAEKFALRTTFRADFNAPVNQRAKIIYSFIAQ